MALFRGLTGNLPVNVLRYVEVYTPPCKSASHDSPKGKLIEDVNARFHRDTAMFPAILGNREKAIPAYDDFIPLSGCAGFTPRRRTP